MRTRRNAGFLAAALTLTMVVAAIGEAGGQQVTRPSRYLYVWTGTGTPTTKGVNSLVVIDVNAASPKYGTVINALTVDTAGSAPHHTEFELPRSGSFFMNDYGADRSYLVDFSDPVNPRIDARTDIVPRAHMVHSFARLPNGNIVATVQHGNENVPGNPEALPNSTERASWCVSAPRRIRNFRRRASVRMESRRCP